jgi:predicted RecA/RadA family phage recombinase
MLGTYIQRGETIDYVNAGAALIPAGTVVSLATRVGIAGCDIAVGATGSLHTTGIFEGVKAAVAIAQGEAVYYDVGNDCFTNVGVGNVPAGWAADAALLADTTVKVLLLGMNVTIPTAAAVAAVAAANGVAVAVADGVVAVAAAPDKAEFDAVVALANANKAEINALVTLANANKAQLNAVIAALKAAGLMAP